MITLKSLQAPKEPFEVQIFPGLSFIVRPMDTFELELARAATDKIMDALAAGISTIEMTGRIKIEGYDAKDPMHVAAMRKEILTKEIAVRQVIGWRGFLKEDLSGPEPFVAEHMRVILNSVVISEVFYQKVMNWHFMFIAAKKECGTAAPGTPPAAPKSAEAVAS